MIAKLPYIGRRRIGVVALGLLLAGCGGAPELETRTFELANVQGRGLVELIQPYVYADRSDSPGMLSYEGNAITVRERPENLERIARVLAEYDRAEPTVLLRFQLIEANGFEGADPAIASVEEELRKLFQFGGYRLVSDAMLRATEGSSASQLVTGGGMEVPYRIQAYVSDVRASESGGTLDLAVELEAAPETELLSTSVNVRAGQTIVLGTFRPGAERNAIILVLTPHVEVP